MEEEKKDPIQARKKERLEYLGRVGLELGKIGVKTLKSGYYYAKQNHVITAARIELAKYRKNKMRQIGGKIEDKIEKAKPIIQKGKDIINAHVSLAKENTEPMKDSTSKIEYIKYMGRFGKQLGNLTANTLKTGIYHAKQDQVITATRIELAKYRRQKMRQIGEKVGDKIEKAKPIIAKKKETIMAYVDEAKEKAKADMSKKAEVKNDAASRYEQRKKDTLGIITGVRLEKFVHGLLDKIKDGIQSKSEKEAEIKDKSDNSKSQEKPEGPILE